MTYEILKNCELVNIRIRRLSGESGEEEYCEYCDYCGEPAKYEILTDNMGTAGCLCWRCLKIFAEERGIKLKIELDKGQKTLEEWLLKNEKKSSRSSERIK